MTYTYPGGCHSDDSDRLRDCSYCLTNQYLSLVRFNTHFSYTTFYTQYPALLPGSPILMLGAWLFLFVFLLDRLPCFHSVFSVLLHAGTVSLLFFSHYTCSLLPYFLLELDVFLPPFLEAFGIVKEFAILYCGIILPRERLPCRCKRSYQIFLCKSHLHQFRT
nr:MAG TPA: hypothetical protein [Caudoviricetes sp.]